MKAPSKGLGFTIISFSSAGGEFLGTDLHDQSLYNNLNGGKDVTYDVMNQIMPRN